MPVNASIFNALAAQPRSVMDYMAAYDQQDARKQSMQANALAIQQTQAQMADQARGRQEQEQIRNALAALGGGATDEARIQALKGTGLPVGFSQADALEKSILERQKTAAQTAKDAAATAKDQYALVRQKLEHGVMGLQVAQSPQQAQAMFADGVQKGYWSMQDAQRQAQTIPQDPAQFMQWRQQQLAQILDAEKQLPKAFDTDQGGSRLFGTIDAVTGARTFNGSQPITVSANTIASNAQSDANNRRTVGEQARAHTMAEARARETLKQSDRHFNARQEVAQEVLGSGKPLPASVLKQMTEARDNAATIDRLAGAFKPEFAGKGVLGLGAEMQMAVSGNIGADGDAVEWWKNYRKQAELIERHALFGAALTPTEQASWRSADIGPGMNAKVVEQNLKTRRELASKVSEATRQDLVDAGHSESRVNKIAGRGAAALGANTVTTPDGKTITFPNAAAAAQFRKAAGL